MNRSGEGEERERSWAIMNEGKLEPIWDAWIERLEWVPFHDGSWWFVKEQWKFNEERALGRRKNWRRRGETEM